jgi:hypothetical protein
MTYPIETRARAALQVTAANYATATGPQDGATEEQSARRKSFLQVRPAVVLTAERAVYRVPDDGKDDRQEKIDALLRIAGVKAAAFAAACEDVDRSEHAALGNAYALMARLRHPVFAEAEPTVSDPHHAYFHGMGRMRFIACSGEIDLGLAAVIDAEQCVLRGDPGPVVGTCDESWDDDDMVTA